MTDHETPKVKRRRGYRPAIVLLVLLAAVMIGVILKFSTREQRSAIIAPEQTKQDDSGLAVPR
jgi:hypothetical protein